jgi:hypothetical protein
LRLEEGCEGLAQARLALSGFGFWQVYPYIRYDYLHQMEAKIDVDIGHTRSDGP